MFKPLIVVPDLLPVTKKLAEACKQCRVPGDDGFQFCAQSMEAMLAESVDHWIWSAASDFTGEAPRVAFDAAIRSRDDQFHLAAAVYWIGCAWMNAVEAAEVDSEVAPAVMHCLGEATKHLRASEMSTSPSRRNNVIQFPAARQEVPMPKVTQFRVELKLATQKVAEACEHCSCNEEDCLKIVATHFRALLAGRRKAKAEPQAINMDAVQIGFDALLGQCHAHFHLAAAARMVTFGWEAIAREPDKLHLACEDTKAALDHVSLAKHGRAIKSECTKLREER